MASITALKTGNWNDSTVWPGGTFPGASDDVFSGGFTVTINQDITVLSLNANGGGFTVSAAPRSITANIVSGTTTCLTCTHSTGTVSVTGNATGGSGSSAHGAYNNAGGSLNITGNATGGIGTNAYGANNNVSGTLNITGNATGDRKSVV